jgi:hypothetical protein
LVGSEGTDCESKVVEPSDGGTPLGLPGTDGAVVTFGVGDGDNDDDSAGLPGTDGAVVTSGVGDGDNDDDSVGLPGTGVAVVTTGVNGVVIGSGVVDGWLVDSPGGTSSLLVCIFEVDGNADEPVVEDDDNDDNSVVPPVTEVVDVVVVVDGTFGTEDVVIESVGVDSEGVDDVVVIVDGTFGMEGVLMESVGVDAEGVDDGNAELVVSPVEELGSSVVLKHDCGIVSTTIKVALTYIPCTFLVPLYEV